MMPGTELSGIYQRLPIGETGPVATAYLDTTRSVENAAGEIELRWRAAREELAAAGADEKTLDAAAAAVGRHRQTPGPQGQVLVAADGQLRYDAVLPHPPRRQIARWAPLPHLMPLVAQLAPVVPYLLVVVDRTGADLRVHGPGGDQETEIEGGDWPVHKAGAGGWRELRYRHRAENLWADNARQVGEAVDAAVGRVAARLVVLAGDVRARHELTRALDERSRGLVVEVDEGGRAAGADSEPLERRVQQLVAEAAARETGAVLERYAEEIGQRDHAVAGLAPTIAALQQAQVDTLLVADDPSSTSEAWVGPEPVQVALDAAQLRDLGVTEPVRDRLDAALVRAAAGTQARIVTVTPGQLDLPDGIGALLRYAPAPAG
jgi:hypothetical protein